MFKNTQLFCLTYSILQGGVNRKKSRASEDRLSGTPRQVISRLYSLVKEKFIHLIRPQTTRLPSGRSQSSASQAQGFPTPAWDETPGYLCQGNYSLFLINWTGKTMYLFPLTKICASAAKPTRISCLEPPALSPPWPPTTASTATGAYRIGTL